MKNGSDAETVCRNRLARIEMQKGHYDEPSDRTATGCRKKAPMQKPKMAQMQTSLQKPM